MLTQQEITKLREKAVELARHRLAEHWRKVGAKVTPPTAPPFSVHEFATPTGTHTVALPPPVADDDPVAPLPPLGRELGRSPIPTPRRQERAALLSIVRASCEVDTVRKAALALLGEEVSRG